MRTISIMSNDFDKALQVLSLLYEPRDRDQVVARARAAHGVFEGTVYFSFDSVPNSTKPSDYRHTVMVLNPGSGASLGEATRQKYNSPQLFIIVGDPNLRHYGNVETTPCIYFDEVPTAEQLKARLVATLDQFYTIIISGDNIRMVKRELAASSPTLFGSRNDDPPPPYSERDPHPAHSRNNVS